MRWLTMIQKEVADLLALLHMITVKFLVERTADRIDSDDDRDRNADGYQTVRDGGSTQNRGYQ